VTRRKASHSHRAGVLVLAILAVASMSGRSLAMNCNEDSISDVSGSGAILEMLSGHIYRVEDADQADSSIWLTAEDVLVCEDLVTAKGKTYRFYKIINKDEAGEEVQAQRLHQVWNLPWQFGRRFN
jgi:hypothetical protein